MNALLSYHYPQYNTRTCNIGDFIQSIAARQFYPQVDYFIDRDSISKIKYPTRSIINGWYKLDDRFHLSPLITPKTISIHISNPKEISNFSRTLEHWASFGPIGCRDEHTRALLEKHGFDAWFSGCLTTTLGNTFQHKPSNESEKTRIIFADVDPKHPTRHLKKREQPMPEHSTPH